MAPVAPTVCPYPDYMKEKYNNDQTRRGSVAFAITLDAMRVRDISGGALLYALKGMQEGYGDVPVAEFAKKAKTDSPRKPAVNHRLTVHDIIDIYAPRDNVGECVTHSDYLHAFVYDLWTHIYKSLEDTTPVALARFHRVSGKVNTQASITYGTLGNISIEYNNGVDIQFKVSKPRSTDEEKTKKKRSKNSKEMSTSTETAAAAAAAAAPTFTTCTAPAKMAIAATLGTLTPTPTPSPTASANDYNGNQESRTSSESRQGDSPAAPGDEWITREISPGLLVLVDTCAKPDEVQSEDDGWTSGNTAAKQALNEQPRDSGGHLEAGETPMSLDEVTWEGMLLGELSDAEDEYQWPVSPSNKQHLGPSDTISTSARPPAATDNNNEDDDDEDDDEEEENLIPMGAALVGSKQGYQDSNKNEKKEELVDKSAEMASHLSKMFINDNNDGDDEEGGDEDGGDGDDDQSPETLLSPMAKTNGTASVAPTTANGAGEDDTADGDVLDAMRCLTLDKVANVCPDDSDNNPNNSKDKK